MRNVRTIASDVMKGAAAADAAANRGSYSAMARAANKLRATL